MNRQSKSVLVAKAMKSITAENEAFAKAGISEGSVEYICPHCGGRAVATRVKRDNHLLIGASCENGCFTSMI